MNKGRLILLLVALVAGGGAFFLVAAGGGGGDTPMAQVIPQQKEAPTVRVLVADVTFERGALLSQETTAWVKWPADEVPEHVVTEENEAFYAEIGSKRARTTIYEGEPIIPAKIVGQGDRGVMAALLTPGMRAVTVELPPMDTAAGFVVPGDRVDVLTLTPDGSVRTAYTDVRVIAIDNVIREENGPLAIQGALVTFELPPSEVARFIALRQSARMSLVLRSLFEGDAPVEDAAPRGEIIVMRYGQP